ncbi:iduronate-2-sulfatase : Iduronate-2-sulfatase OS=Planctomyces brasiliensis (strain ATCC 49424 / DSM 5305 / JCM 21570 / NBRC 103401 / IFAM 1448) GN=Plabr_3210 PE=4 SV=1: Sulfatase [Gemmataceae bacterium]|nr:iduronate-2-sulfatase : Iduronate-2-sulfatase OS=Planctomyces brasiliensis (strain ATCC 49424 / DSM 5305 / JCM 21570 / NBRC 103401 / IFAM 1448) GN=Plabr_3210 PE=4 SV=1: Sulfatase [Gemmataceae bacterium]VTU02502.1 iduronate-2-sulfatase : Iduronate-2-sulfatase OS=Planctomyces brasiliensis (strain ATCC 49424 / DSM 5305 / JCM 21570 / NBRC 103401 / IFAM 1448) GN=Plabr_3210 PE=4 SV=1: Sulfatase [Gemmataceae bacterium]
MCLIRTVTVAMALTGLLSPAVAHAAEPSPNVLLIVADDLRACLGTYGSTVCKTPNLDRLAREGVQFNRAYCQFVVCGPSRASIMSGLYPGTTKMLGNSQAVGSYKSTNPHLKAHPSVAELLRRNGYFSARVSKIYHMSVPGGIEAGTAGGDEPDSWDWTYNVCAPESRTPGKLRDLTPDRDWGTKFATLEVDDAAATQADVLSAQQAVAILESRSSRTTSPGDKRIKPEAPFFLAVGFVRPHVPFVVPRRWARQYAPTDMVPPKVPVGDLDDVPEPGRRMSNALRYKMSEAAQQEAIAGYYASVSFMDEQVGKLLDALDRLRLRQNTVVVFVSDHGYNLGEHDCWQKLSLFEDSTRVPLIISAPRHKAAWGKKSEALVELVDLYPTLADLAGAGSKIPALVQGRSLRPLLEEPTRDDWQRRSAYTLNGDGESVRTRRWRFTSWGKAGEELYDHDHDKEEYKNLARDATYTNVLKEMRVELGAARERSVGPK